jgi:hypothetical protein
MYSYPALLSAVKLVLEITMLKEKKTAAELEALGLKRIRAWPGCRGVVSVTLTLDDDGEWSFGAYEPGQAEVDVVRRVAIAVSNQLHDEFDLATDT